MISLRNVVVAVALVAAQGCNKSESRKQADKAADTLSEHKQDAVADADFRAKRDVRYRALESQLQAIGVQPMLINAMSEAFPLTDAGRANVTVKLQAFQMCLDRAKNQIGLVRTSLPDYFKDADAKATDAMNKLNDARKDAWDALDKAPRTDRSS